MEVDILDSSEIVDPPKHAVVKLYDRRYALQLREDKKIVPWTQSVEEQYREFVGSGEAAEFIAALEEDDDTGDDVGQPWDAARDEAFLFDFCRDLYISETEAYRRLEDLQGRNVPKAFAKIRLKLWSSSDPPSVDTRDFFEVPGILMEYIRGYDLAKMMFHAPSSTWQNTCEEAIRIVNVIGDHGILNEDIKTRNVLIREEHQEGGLGPSYNVVFFDFGQCQFLGPDQSEESWVHEKNLQDEEGVIGWVMEKKLKGIFKYQPSRRFSCQCSGCVEV